MFCNAEEQRLTVHFASDTITTHYFEKREVKSAIATAGSCTDAPAYYYSCACGLNDTGNTFKGQLLSHVYDKTVATEDYLAEAATCTSLAKYYKSCVCGEFDTSETFTYGSPLGHGNWTYTVGSDGVTMQASCGREGCPASTSFTISATYSCICRPTVSQVVGTAYLLVGDEK